MDGKSDKIQRTNTDQPPLSLLADVDVNCNDTAAQLGISTPTEKLRLSAQQLQRISDLPQTALLRTTLYQIGEEALVRRQSVTGEQITSDAIFHEVNRIMVLNGYPRANLAGKTNISDRNLPKAWNNVVSHQKFILYSKTGDSLLGAPLESPEADSSRDAFRRQSWQNIVEQTSTLPLLRGEGYYQVLERMHPGWSPRAVLDEAIRIKKISGNRDVLSVGERLPLLTEQERLKILNKQMGKYDKRHQHPGGPTPGPSKPEPIPNPTKPEPIPNPSKPEPIPNPTKPEPIPNPTKPEPIPNPTKPEPIPNPTKPEPIPNPTKPKPVPNPPKPEPASETANLTDIAAQLEKAHKRIALTQSQNESAQGLLGQTVDAAKNYLGTSAKDRSAWDPRALWSNLLDSDLGSSSINNVLADEAHKIEKLKDAASRNDLSSFSDLYTKLTGKPLDPACKIAAPLLPLALIKQYDSSQRSGIDTTTDIAAALGSSLVLRGSGGRSLSRTLLLSTATGGAVKSSLMQLDGHYANLPRDLSMGMLWGATVPVGELAGAKLSRIAGSKWGLPVVGDMLTARIETAGSNIGIRLLSAATKSGTSGAVFGAIESPLGEVIRRTSDGRSFTASELLGRTVSGAGFGFVGGTLFGAVFDGIIDGFRSRRPIRPSAGPGAGPVTLDEAAPMLGTTAADLADKAVRNPYAAVEDAYTLYQKTGLNIRKFDPASGKSPLPASFAKALGLVQEVDALTADAGASVSTKINVVRTTDEFLQRNAQAIEESFGRIRSDKNYQAVVALTAERNGPAAATQFEKTFRGNLEKDLQLSMSVDRVKNSALSNAEAFQNQLPKTEDGYFKKAADFYKDMTDPAQRARLNALTDEIYDKFHPETITREQLAGIINGVPKEDRNLAVALLEASAVNSSEGVVGARLQALRPELENLIGSHGDYAAWANTAFTLAPDSSGNMLGYLYRKSNSMGMRLQNFDALAECVANGHTPSKIVLFDDLASTALTPEQKVILAKIPKVYVADLCAFEKGINILDMARGPEVVAQKLNSLLAEARTIAAANPQLIPTGVAQEVLYRSVDRVATSLGANVTVIRPTGRLSIPHMPPSQELSAMSTLDSLYTQLSVPRASKEEIAQFLSQYAGEERELAASMLADGAVYNSFAAMFNKARQMHSELVQRLLQSGLSIRDLRLVTDKDPGGSTHLITYLYGKANGLSPENFISNGQLNKLIANGGARGKAAAYFDDTIYSGSQTAGMLDVNYASFMNFKKVVVGSLGAYQKGLNLIGGTNLAMINGKLDVVTASLHHPFYSQQHPFFSTLSADAQSTVQRIGGSDGFGQVQGSLIWSYMYPDNNLEYFRHKFSGGVLRLPGP